MSMQHAYDERLEFDMADRLRRALRIADVSVAEMAEHLQVSRNTVGNWINGRAVPRNRDKRDFALRCGVPLEWVETGKSSGPDTPTTPSRLGESNPGPIHYKGIGQVRSITNRTFTPLSIAA